MKWWARILVVTILLFASSAFAGNVDLHWTDGCIGESNMVVDASVDGVSNWNFVVTLDANSVSTTVNSVAAGHWCFRVHCVRAAENSPFSNVACLDVTTLSGAPTGLTATQVP